MADAASWKFRQMQRGEMNIDPIEAQFFSTEALGSLADALVREAIQNSLDARLPGRRLRIRIYFSSAESVSTDIHQSRYTAGLWEHLEAPGSGLLNLPARADPLPFVVIEDFGTRGLQGHPRQSEDDEPESDAPRNDFYYFWRNIGRSRKHASELGRWGLGKTVFSAASRINSFFGVTVQADDRRRLLMGQSVLKIHKVGGQRFYPYGYFGRFEQEFALPVDDPAFVDEFCRDFHIARGQDPGLSVVIPYPDPDLNSGTVAPSIIRHYFVPIIADDLVVDVIHRGKTDHLDSQSLSRFLSQLPSDEGKKLGHLIELARWGMGLQDSQRPQLKAPPANSAPRWTQEQISVDLLGGLRERFNGDQPIAVTVPVWVKPKKKIPVLSRFEVYLERDDTIAAPEEHFVRDGITIAGVRGSLQKGVRAIVSVRERALSELLGDSENPAHTEWQERSPKFKDRYLHGPSTLRYVRNAPREIVRILTQPTEGRDYQLLQQLFPRLIPTEEAVKVPQKPREENRGGESTWSPDDIETVGKDHFFQLQKLQGGFRLVGSGNPDGMPAYVAVWVAYEVRRGNPFAQYQPPDFELDKPPITVLGRDAMLVRRQGNLLVLKVQKPTFRVTVKGFDEHRDLRVKVLPSEETATR